MRNVKTPSCGDSGMEAAAGIALTLTDDEHGDLLNFWNCGWWYNIHPAGWWCSSTTGRLEDGSRPFSLFMWHIRVPTHLKLLMMRFLSWIWGGGIGDRYIHTILQARRWVCKRLLPGVLRATNLHWWVLEKKKKKKNLTVIAWGSPLTRLRLHLPPQAAIIPE